MLNVKTLVRWIPLAGAASLAVALTGCGGSSPQVTNFSEATFQNGLALAGDAVDLSTGTAADRRLGYFSDIYYDATRKEWWGLSDRGPGGGLLNYETRVQRFEVDISATGSISNFRVVETVKFMRGTQPFNGIAPSPTTALGNAFDPEGIVINPKNGNLLVSDEYGPSL